MRLPPASSWTVFPKGAVQKVKHRSAALPAAQKSFPQFTIPFVLTETID